MNRFNRVVKPFLSQETGIFSPKDGKNHKLGYGIFSSV